MLMKSGSIHSTPETFMTPKDSDRLGNFFFFFFFNSGIIIIHFESLRLLLQRLFKSTKIIVIRARLQMSIEAMRASELLKPLN